MPTATTLPISAYRNRMLSLQGEAKSYQFLSLVDLYLERVPDDHKIRLLAVREYLALGLVEPAGELLDVDPAKVILPPELTVLRESLSAIPPPASSRHAEQFDRNLAALSTRGVDVRVITDAWSAAQGRYRFFRDKHDADQVRRLDGDWKWFPYFGHHRAVDDAQNLPEGVGETNMPGPYLFEGVGLGRYFERVYHATRNTFLGFSCAIYVVEPQAELFAVALHLNDWSDLLADPRVLVLLGSDWAESLGQAFEQDPDLPLPHQVITCGPPASGRRAIDVIQDAAESRQCVIQPSLDALNQRYALRDVSYWAPRFEAALTGGPPLRILAAVSIHTTFLQHSMRDAKRALESLGHQCVVLSEQTPYTVTSPLTFHKAIRDLDPDLFFVLDHLRPEFEGVIPRNLPVLTWDQDQLPHVLTRVNLARIAQHDFVVGCSKAHCVAHGCNPRQFLHARVPTCPEQFGGDPLTDQELEGYTCDVSYVSHASQTPQQFHEQEQRSLGDPALIRLLDTMYERLPGMLTQYRVVDGGVMSFVLSEACKRAGVTRLDPDLEERLRSWYLWRLGDRMFRHQALEWVGEWAQRTGRQFRIYGRGWDRHPTLARFAAGPADNGRELLCIYRASKVNLQLMPAGFIHQRALDGLAAGGFFLTRLCPQDLSGRTLRRLNARLDDLAILSTDQLLSHGDALLQQLLRDYMGGWLYQMDHRKYDLLNHIRLSAELRYPDEVFADFSNIVFDSAGEFADRAERSLNDTAARQEIAARMRQVVVERFSYRATMDHFLRSMAAYLRQTVSASKPS
jgi:hypothetical protein